MRPWKDLAAKDNGNTQVALFERLKLLHTRGYELSFIWPDDDHNFVAWNKLTDAAKAGIRDYNAWTPP